MSDDGPRGHVALALALGCGLLSAGVASAAGWPERGIELGARYRGDAMSDATGGARRGRAYAGQLDLTAAIDAEKLLRWHGGELLLHGLANHGESPSRDVGDLQTVSNIDAPTAAKLYQAWAQQSLLGGRLSLRAGLYDLNSEFDSIDTAGLFVNASHGVGKDLSQSGQNGPSIFPTTSLAWRVWAQPAANWYVQGVVLDGVPGDPAHPRGTHVRLRTADGLLLVSEAGFLQPGTEHSRYTKLALGSWLYTAEFETLAERDRGGRPRSGWGNFGVYAFAESAVYREPDDPDQGLALFGRVGTARARFNAVQYYAGAGLVYTGLLPGHADDQLGLAVAAAIGGAPYRRALRAAGERGGRAEVNLELSYRLPLGGGLALQPDLQYVIRPGMDPRLANALVIGARIELGL